MPRSIPCFVFLLALLPAAPLRAGSDPFHEAVLENGLRVTVVHAPDAPLHGFFTLLPLGLLSDDVGEAQWSHLFEHVLLRSTAPEHLLYEYDGMLMNGETTALVLRLETLAPPERWRDAQRLHRDWLDVSRLEPSAPLGDMLEREKRLVAREVEGTSAAGAGHKWAMAAWNQVVRHGASHAEVLGDVERAGLRAILAALMGKVAVDDSLRLLAVGPRPPAEVLAAIREDFGTLRRTPPARRVHARTARERLRAPVQLAATWDVPGRHYLEWFPVPDRDARDRMAADALALLLNTRLHQRQTLLSLGVQVLASADLVLPEGRWLLVSASLPEGVEVTRVRDELRAIYSSLEAQEVALLVGEMGRQVVEWPDFAALRREVLADPETAAHAAQLDVIESQQALFLFYAQANMGLERKELLAYPTLTSEEVLELAEIALDPARRSSLLLEPRGR